MDAILTNILDSQLPFLDERQRRLTLAIVARELGRGGKTEVSEQFKISRTTINQGLSELEELKNDEDAANKIVNIRKSGGGRKKSTEKDPTLVEALLKVVSAETFGSPENPLLWTTKSLRNLEETLQKSGHNVSYRTIAELLKENGYSLHLNQKMLQVGKSHPDRDSQFKYINNMTITMSNNGDPTISVDCKKKELVGLLKNNGSEYAEKGKPVKVRDHDYVIPELGKAVPYGVYDINKNLGFVSVGVSSDTAQFAVTSIETWWNEMGKELYPNSKNLYIVADGGGSNGSRNRLWKKELKEFAQRTGLNIYVSHFPPGTSKWNKIEHRLFCQISKNWRGRPLESLEIIVNLIANTTTNTGLKVKCVLDKNQYQTGIKISNKDIAKLNIIKDEFHGEWNYLIKPES